MAKWIKDNEVYNGRYVVADGVKYICPSEAKLEQLGYTMVVEEPVEYEPTTDELTRPYKDALAAEDYKVIKCMEAYLRGKPLPYDIDTLGEARDAVREQINALEEGAEQHE